MENKITGYCLRCKKKVEIQNSEEVETKNKRKMYKGKCPDCGTTVCKFLASVKVEDKNN